MPGPPEDFDPLSVAMSWVARITTVALEMVIPGLVGSWLDQRFGTSYLVVLGFAFGFVAGLWHLLQLTKEGRTAFRSRPRRGPPDENVHD